MIIHTLSDLYNPGYIENERHVFITPFFAGANVAFRKEVFDEVGEYDEKCIYAEDKDMGIRLAKAGKTLYFQPKAVVTHRNTDSIKGFIRKWYLYGKGHSYLFRKHSDNDVEIYIPKKDRSSSSLYKCILSINKFPFKAAIFINSFLLSQIFLLACIISILAGNTILSVTALGAFLGSSLSCFKGCFNKENWIESLGLFCLGYLLNTSLLVGGVIGGIKNRVVFIYGTLILNINSGS